jgi:hypothetical protein
MILLAFSMKLPGVALLSPAMANQLVGRRLRVYVPRAISPGTPNGSVNSGRAFTSGVWRRR